MKIVKLTSQVWCSISSNMRNKIRLDLQSYEEGLDGWSVPEDYAEYLMIKHPDIFIIYD